MPKHVRRSKAEMVDNLRRVISDWQRAGHLTDAQVVTYMAMVASGYAERAYVDLPHDAPPNAEPFKPALD